MHQRLVIAILVGRAELQMSVEEKLETGPALGDHNALIRRVLGVDNRIGVHRILGQRRQSLRLISGRSSQVPHSPTAAFNIPKTSDVRGSPSFGTKNSGNSTEATSAPM